jgi:hypothetical protein
MPIVNVEQVGVARNQTPILTNLFAGETEVEQSDDGLRLVRQPSDNEAFVSNSEHKSDKPGSISLPVDCYMLAHQIVPRGHNLRRARHEVKALLEGIMSGLHGLGSDATDVQQGTCTEASFLFELGGREVKRNFVDASPVDNGCISAIDSRHNVILPVVEVEWELGAIQETLDKHCDVDTTLPS